jgi:hypothetical protein
MGNLASPGKHLLISYTVRTMWPFYTAGKSNAVYQVELEKEMEERWE